MVVLFIKKKLLIDINLVENVWKENEMEMCRLFIF